MQPVEPPAPDPPGPGSPPTSRSWIAVCLDRLRRLLEWNPCYLLSATFLLLGIYRISVDPTFLPSEIQQLGFNFTSLQGYEILLVVTAIVLGRRQLRYDATLLVTLETALVLVPFILVSHASLIDPNTVWGFCGAGLALVALRVGGLRRGLVLVQIPGRLLSAGSLLVVANALMPILYRTLHESKFGTKPDFGAAFHTNEWLWRAGLPALVALANLRLGASVGKGGRVDAQDEGPPWLPDLFLGLLLLGSGVQFWSLSYVYDFDIRRDLATPALWVGAWTLVRRLSHAANVLPFWVRTCGLVAPAVIALLPMENRGSLTVTLLAALNGCIYAVLRSRGGNSRLTSWLGLISLICAVFAWPSDLGLSVLGGVGSSDRVLGALLSLALLAAVISSEPVAGLGGAVAGWLIALRFAPGLDHRFLWLAQIPLVAILLHGLRWPAGVRMGWDRFRMGVAALWSASSMVLQATDEAGAWVSAGGLGVLAVASAVRWLGGLDVAKCVLAAAVWVLLIAPADACWQFVRLAPTGVLAMVVSLLLFALATAMAWTRARWQRVVALPPAYAIPPESRGESDLP